MRIGFLFDRLVFNIAYRAEAVAEVLQRQGHDVVVVARVGRTFDPKPLRTCDVVHVYRMSDEAVRRCVEDLQQRGVAITWDNDDDVRLMPPEFDRRAKVTGHDREREWRNQVKMLQRADVVTATSDHLVQVFTNAGARHVVRIENYLFAGQYRKPQRSGSGVVVGWVAGGEHEACDRMLGVSAFLRDALDRHPTLRVVSVGVRLGLHESRYEHHPEIPLAQLNDCVRSFDVAIAPLGDIPMSYARSNVKVKEYAAAGVPWLASARGPYVGLGAKQGGVLVEDGDWPPALDALIASGFKRRLLARRARAWAKTQAIDRHVDEWLAAFTKAIEVARARTPAARAPLPTG